MNKYDGISATPLSAALGILVWLRNIATDEGCQILYGAHAHLTKQARFGR